MLIWADCVKEGSILNPNDNHGIESICSSSAMSHSRWNSMRELNNSVLVATSFQGKKDLVGPLTGLDPFRISSNASVMATKTRGRE
jgi:hypothetical protein